VTQGDVIMTNRHGRLGYRIAGDRRGAAAAEFALVLPVLTAMMFGTLEFGTMLFSYSAMQSAARDVTRQVSVNVMSASAAETAIRDRLPPWTRSSATISLEESAPGNPSTNVYRTVVAAPAQSAAVLAFFSRAKSWNLVTEVEMKQELPFAE
jgi:Flp pilus assembly protein TadG